MDHAAPAPILSIITVCKDIASQIGDTCASVARQTWRDFEWLVVDGASTDGTLAELGKYRERMAHFISEPDRGVYHAMNKGIALARGEYLLFLNGGDCLVAPDTLEKIFSAKRNSDLLYGDELHFYPESGYLDFRKNPPAFELDKLFFAFRSINHQAVFFRRELFERFGPYDESLSLEADHEKLVILAANSCLFEKLDFPISRYRMDGLTARRGAAKRRKEEQGRRVREKHFSPDELREADRRHRERGAYRRILAWGGRFSFFAIDETRDGRKRKYRFLGLPVLKCRWRRGRRRAWLFGFIPLPWTGGNPFLEATGETPPPIVIPAPQTSAVSRREVCRNPEGSRCHKA